MIYDKKLLSADDIEVKTYHKCSVCTMPSLFMEDVVVNSIDTEAGTVNATVGSMEDIDYPKDWLFKYINFFYYG